MYCDPAWVWKVYGAGFQARVSAKNATRQPRRSMITGCSAISRPNPEPTNRTPARVSRRSVRRRGENPTRIGRRVRVRCNRALEIPEGDVRRGERVTEREERVEGVALQQSLLCEPSAQIDVPYRI